MTGISIVICAYNEEQNLPTVVKETDDVLRTLTGDFEIIVVDDGSTDRTQAVLARLSGEFGSLKVIRHPKNLGMGAAIKNGFFAATKDLVSFLPADGEVSPGVIRTFAEAIEGADVVLSYRTERNVSLTRKILSRGIRILMVALFGYFPRIEGTYFFRREVLSSMALRSSSFTVNYEFVIKAYKKGCRFKEIAIKVMPRLSGKSKILNIKTVWRVFKEIILFRVNYR